MTQEERRQELVSLAGQAINGMLSADESIWTKLIDRTIHEQVAMEAVSVAIHMQKIIDKHDEEETQQN